MQSPLFQNKYRVLSARRPGWDYSDAAHYFITIVTDGRRNYFGDVQDGKMVLSPIGNIVCKEWVRTGEIRKDHARLDEWIIMPNHIHMILEICLDDTKIEQTVKYSSVETPRWGVLAGGRASDQNTTTPSTTTAETPQRGVSTVWQSHSLGSIINQFKSACTKIIRTNIDPTFTWQSRYHDHIIRDDLELGRIRKYIRENPLKWEEDELFST